MKQCLNAWRANSFTIDVCAREASKLHLRGKMATQLLANVEEEWTKKRMGILMDFEDERAQRICSFRWADNFWIMSHSKKKNLEQMLRDLIEEAGRWNLVPKPTRLWWTGTYDPEERIDVSIYTTTGCHKFPLEEKFRILGNVMNRKGKSDDAIEERMQSANKAFWKDILISKSKDVPWKMQCRRLVDHVYAVFAFGSENWPWTVLTVDKTKGWEIKGMLRLFRFKRR